MSLSMNQDPRTSRAMGVSSRADLEHRRLIARQLETEFAGRLAPVDIERIAEASIEGFHGAPVRTFVPILAIRSARRLAWAELTDPSKRNVSHP